MELKNGDTTMAGLMVGKDLEHHDGHPADGIDAAEIQIWLVAYLAELLGVAAEDIDVTVPLDRYGLDSAGAVGLTGDLMTWLECRLDPTIFYEHPTIESLALHLAGVARDPSAI